jgi:hypothetical protein
MLPSEIRHSESKNILGCRRCPKIQDCRQTLGWYRWRPPNIHELDWRTPSSCTFWGMSNEGTTPVLRAMGNNLLLHRLNFVFPGILTPQDAEIQVFLFGGRRQTCMRRPFLLFSRHLGRSFGPMVILLWIVGTRFWSPITLIAEPALWDSLELMGYN